MPSGLPSERSQFIDSAGKPTPDFNRWMKKVAKVTTFASQDDATGNADSGDVPIIIYNQGIPAPYISRLSEPAHAGKIYRDGAWYELERYDGVYPQDFGAVNALNEDGSINHSLDCITAITDAIDYCKRKRRAVIRFTSGIWQCKSGGIVFPVGINAIGHGHSSSQSQGGTVILADYNEATSTNAFMAYDGSGEQFNSTGGGLHSLTIQKGAAKTGGTLLKITGVDDSHRPGYMTFRDLELAGGNQGASCDYCIVHYGGNLTTSSGQGLRDFRYDNVFFNTWTQVGAQFNNATHCVITGMLASPGVGGGNAMEFTGNSNAATHKTVNCRAYGLGAYGNGPIVIDKVHQSIFSGRSTYWVVTGDCTGSTIIPIGDNRVSLLGATRSSLFGQGTRILDAFIGQTFGTITNGGMYLEGGRVRKWMNATSVGTTSATYYWASALGAADVPFISTPVLTFVGTGSGALTTPGYDNVTALSIDLRAQAASQTVRVVAEGPY